MATSMVDFSTLIGLYPHLGRTKKIYYFHENQFEYPLSKKQQFSNVESMMVNLYGALAADKIIFNSSFNRETFFNGAEKLLKKINDHSPISVLEGIKNNSSIIPVPICNRVESEIEKIPNSIIWNHRWEYDKNPEEFYNFLLILKERNIEFKLIMMGIQFKNTPKAFNQIKEEFSEHLLCWGEQKKEDYLKWLSKGAFVVSTAIHEFQGLAVMEAVQYGAIPIVPNRLSYPQWFSSKFLYNNTPEALVSKLIELKNDSTPPPQLNELTWDYLKKKYTDML